MTNCLEGLYSILNHKIEVDYKVLEHYVNPMSSYHPVRILRWVFNY